MATVALDLLEKMMTGIDDEYAGTAPMPPMTDEQNEIYDELTAKEAKESGAELHKEIEELKEDLAFAEANTKILFTQMVGLRNKYDGLLSALGQSPVATDSTKSPLFLSRSSRLDSVMATVAEQAEYLGVSQREIVENNYPMILPYIQQRTVV